MKEFYRAILDSESPQYNTGAFLSEILGNLAMCWISGVFGTEQLAVPTVRAQSTSMTRRPIWLTDGSRRTPVKVQTAVRVGSETAVLAGGTYPSGKR